MKHADFKFDILSGLIEARSTEYERTKVASGLCEGVIRREATETEGLVYYKNSIVVCLCVCVCLFVRIVLKRWRNKNRAYN